MLNNYKKMYIFDALFEVRRDSKTSVNQSGRASIICSLQITRIALKRINQTFKIYIFLILRRTLLHILEYILYYTYTLYILYIRITNTQLTQRS